MQNINNMTNKRDIPMGNYKKLLNKEFKNNPVALINYIIASENKDTTFTLGTSFNNINNNKNPYLQDDQKFINWLLSKKPHLTCFKEEILFFRKFEEKLFLKNKNFEMLLKTEDFNLLYKKYKKEGLIKSIKNPFKEFYKNSNIDNAMRSNLEYNNAILKMFNYIENINIKFKKTNDFDYNNIYSMYHVFSINKEKNTDIFNKIKLEQFLFIKELFKVFDFINTFNFEEIFNNNYKFKFYLLELNNYIVKTITILFYKTKNEEKIIEEYGKYKLSREKGQDRVSTYKKDREFVISEYIKLIKENPEISKAKASREIMKKILEIRETRSYFLTISFEKLTPREIDKYKPVNKTIIRYINIYLNSIKN
jgi:hypothetical protein